MLERQETRAGDNRQKGCRVARNDEWQSYGKLEMTAPESYISDNADMFISDVQETPPTPDQLTSILDYVGPSKAGTVVEEATGTSDALRKFNAKQQAFQRPVTVDWNNGRAGEYNGLHIQGMPVRRGTRWKRGSIEIYGPDSEPKLTFS